MTTPTQYAVIGHPVAHSRSPRIHAQFAAATGQQLEYTRIDASEERFADAVREFFAAGGHGLNVTVPHKQRAFEFADHRSAAAQRAGAVNTLRREPDGSVYGDNTDGVGLLRDLTQNLGLTLSGRRILLLGAGGAARGCLAPLLEQKLSLLLIVNRTAARARELVAAFGPAPVLSGGGIEQLAGQQPFDLIVNATAAGLSGEVLAPPPHCFTDVTFCYDMLYGREPTPFLRWAQAAGMTRLADGLGMLVEQAAESFFIWRGVRPDTAPVLAALRRELAV